MGIDEERLERERKEEEYWTSVIRRDVNIDNRKERMKNNVLEAKRSTANTCIYEEEIDEVLDYDDTDYDDGLEGMGI